MEIFKIIEDYPNYEVSNLGNVRNIKTGRVLKPGETNKGYLKVVLCKEGQPKSLTVHRLVANAFIPNPEHKRTVNHISGDKRDNRVENLEWVTHSENIRHAFRTGLNFHIHTDKTGRPKKMVRCIETGQEFESMGEASKYFGVGRGSIYNSIHKGCRCKQFHFELV